MDASPPSMMRGDRVVLRPWRPSDLRPFAALNADPVVMEHFPSALTPDESDAAAQRIAAHFTTHGFGLWALEVPGLLDFAGFVGLAVVSFEAPFTQRAPGAGAVEIGWRLARSAWGNGYAAEGARLALGAAFGPLGLSEVVSFTVPANARSRRVMERIGMRRSPAEDFDHPRLPEGHPLRAHVLYRVTKDEWRRPRPSTSGTDC